MFRTLFGDTPRVRILDFLADHVDFDYSITDISNGSEVPRNTVYRNLKSLVSESIMVQTRLDGPSRMFQLNLKNPKVQALLRFEMDVINESESQRKIILR